MSEVIINEQNLIDIADAIRLKLGVETEYKPSEMAGAIEEIEGGTYGTKEIDSNGTYNASDDGYTGYSQVTVNVQGGGGSDFLVAAYWDFTTSLVDKINGVTATLYGSPTRDSDGIHITSGSQAVEFPGYLFMPGFIYEIKFGDMSKQFTSDYHGRLMNIFPWNSPESSLNETNTGLIFHKQTQKFGVWDAVNLWQDSTVSDADYFSNSTVKIVVDIDGSWKIYKDDVLVFEPAAALPLQAKYFAIGGLNKNTSIANNTFYNMDIKSFKIYTGTTQDKVKVLKRMGYLYDGWWINSTGVLKYDPSDLQCFLEVFEVQAGHKYVWCFGSNNGNRGTAVFTDHDIYNDPVDNLSCSLKFSLETTERIAYQSKPILNVTSDGYIGAYTANAMGTGSESYLIDITDIDD